MSGSGSPPSGVVRDAESEVNSSGVSGVGIGVDAGVRVKSRVEWRVHWKVE